MSTPEKSVKAFPTVPTVHLTNGGNGEVNILFESTFDIMKHKITIVNKNLLNIG